MKSDDMEKIIEQNAYKSTEAGTLSKEIEEDLRKNLQKFKDPVVLGELVFRLLEERENTNRILKTLMKRIEDLEGKVKQVERIEVKLEKHAELLPEVDQKIMGTVRELGKATAQEIQQRLNYKGRNGASARLNKLYSIGLLDKKQVGRKVYFLPK